MTVEPGATEQQSTSSGQAWGEDGLLEALRAGDEAAFEALLGRYHGTLVRLAMVYVGDRAVAEEVAQDTWLGLLRGLERFEGRASLKTWLFRILVNRARTRAQREGRSLPFSALASANVEPDEPSVDPQRFLPPDHARWPRHWRSPPREWDIPPEAWLLSRETRACLQAAIDALPPSQRAVVTLRDVEGWTPDEVCAMLSISVANQRVLLHRARSKVRRAVEQYFADE